MKEILRKEFARQRDSLLGEDRRQISSLAADRLEALPVYQDAAKVALYASFRSETETQGLIASALAQGRKVALPLVRRESGSLEFFWIESWEDLRQGAFGILEPQEDPSKLAEGFSLILVPGLAFDLRGRRLGYGAGYYDKFLAGFSGLKLGFAFDFQVVESLPEAGHDVAMDQVVTEKRIIDCDLHSPRNAT
jgi:5-formyltetrahydrofolate cyclo-ligase